MKSYAWVLLCFSILFFSCSSGRKATEPSALKEQNEFTVTKNVEYTVVKNIHLTMDIYVPKTGKTKYPVLVIFHGGGWLINTNAIMNQASEYIASHGEYIVCNVNYRLLGDNNNTTTMNEIVEDAFGAVLWIKEHIAEYGGDSSAIAITGDSAGGHLAAMILLCSSNLESDGFAGATLGFSPSYLPKNKTAEEIAKEHGLTIQAAIFSYGAFDIFSISQTGFETAGNIFWMLAGKSPRGIFGDSISVKKNPDWYKEVSPIWNIPNSAVQKLPPILCTVGTRDMVTPPSSVKQFVDSLRNAGHFVEYWEHEGRPHAFLDSGSNPYLGINFEKDAPPALDKMISFLNSVF